MGNILSALSLNRMSSIAVQARAAFDDNDLLKLTDDSMGGRLAFGLQVTAIGLSIVFAVLIGLWLILSLSGTIFQRLANKQTNAESVSETVSAPEPVAEIEITEEPEEDEEELISVLTAAIAASIQKPVTGFRVVSFKKRGAWKNGG